MITTSMAIPERLGGRIPRDEDLVFRIPFCEHVGNVINDLSQNRNKGTCYGPVWASSDRGTVLSLDGTDDYVNFDDPINNDGDFFRNAPWTVVLAVHMPSQGGWNLLWEAQTGKGGLYENGATKELSLRGYVGGSWTVLCTASAFDDWGWLFIIVWTDGTNYKIYVNNEEKGSSSYQQLDGGSAFFRLGWSNTYSPEALYADLKIFDRALTEDERTHLYEDFCMQYKNPENYFYNLIGVVLKDVTDSISLSDAVLCDKTLSVTDQIGLADSVLRHKPLVEISDSVGLTEQVLRHKPLVEISDSIGLSDQILAHKTLVISDSISLSELVTVITEIIKEVTDSISLTDQVSVDKSLVIVTDSISILDSPLVNKILQIADSIGLSEIVAVIKPGVVKTKIFLRIGDLSIQLTGD